MALLPAPAYSFNRLVEGEEVNIGVIVFPGSNCDHDCEHVFKDVLGQKVTMIWHKETSLAGLDGIVLPGGFSYGDYLRTGAIARFSPVMGAIKAFARQGGLVLGVCNGFQILLEAGLLPGAMLRNRSLHFVCKDVHVRVENAATPFTGACTPGQVLRIPVAHAEGNYYTDPVTLAGLQANAQIVLRYCSPEGRVTPESNPNGSLDNIAGICNAEGNVFGIMPHPERCAEELLSNQDGRFIFASMLDYVRKQPLKMVTA
jgi:phosphoribosylformylglycinamidine synthase